LVFLVFVFWLGLWVFFFFVWLLGGKLELILSFFFFFFFFFLNVYSIMYGWGQMGMEFWSSSLPIPWVILYLWSVYPAYCWPLTFFPQVGNVLLTAFVFACTAHEIHRCTETLLPFAVPEDWRKTLRNVFVFLLILIPIGVSDGMFWKRGKVWISTQVSLKSPNCSLPKLKWVQTDLVMKEL